MTDVPQLIEAPPLVTPPVTTAQNRRMIRARFDSEFTTDENRRHWALADVMSIDSAASASVRKTLRSRSRYEYHNNGYYQGIVSMIANYVIGTGPRLQMLLADKSLNALIEKVWQEWSREVRLGQTLRSMRMARIYNGESFALLQTNNTLLHPVKLDVREVEADQVSSPVFYSTAQPNYDGVIVDRFGRPVTYHVLRQHPGAYGLQLLLGTEFEAWPARYVIHDFKHLRPGQQRGIPESLPALPLFAQLRRYTLAVLGAAETAADYAMTIETDAPADGDLAELDPMDTFELEPRMATVLPAGAKLNQTKPEQPTTTHREFCNAILCEIARCLEVPLFLASLDAAQANMSSAYVVMQVFAKGVQVDRGQYDVHLDQILDEFLTEALRVPGLLPAGLPREFPHTWRWPRINDHADPQKVAAAAQAKLAAGIASIPQLCADDEQDWEELQDSAAKAYGLSLDEYRKALRDKTFSAGGQPASGQPNSAEPAPVVEEE